MKNGSKIKIRDILNEYIKGLNGYKMLFSITLFFFILATLVDIVIPYIYKNFFNILNSAEIKSGVFSSLFTIILIVGLLHLVSWLFGRIAFFMFISSSSHSIAQLKQNSFRYLIKHSHNFFSNTFSGGLVQKISRHGRAFDRLADTLVFNFIPLIFTIIGATIVTFFTSKILSLIILLWIAVYFICSFVFYRWRMKYSIAMAATDSETTALLADNISNSQAISLFDAYEEEDNSFIHATNKLAKAEIKNWNYAGIYDSIQMLLVYIAEFSIFYFAIKYWQADKLTVGGIIMIQIYVISMAKQIWSVNMILRNVFQSIADSKEMTEIMNTPHDVQNIPNAQEINVSSGTIEFKDIVFNFNETRTVLSNINCQIKAGEKVGIIGPSGAGKTTFVRLILRLYNLTSGCIYIDGQDISKVTQESLRRNISLVPQDPVLFHRSLRENIRYGKPEATDEEILNASRLAHCDDFIDGLSEKYETLVGERGIKLSGGERQRIAIARAILKNAPILILDEATSSLDSHSEALIQKAFTNLMKNKTTIAIAHRLSTIKKMDRIIVMEDGKIIEEGTHSELANKDSGLYKDLWELQAGGFIQK